MYTNFFSLSELPFSIAPNPKYLFMSDRHREALAHLSYGLGGSNLGDNGGFVLLTGEVGTGKTTVSRCLMAEIPENTQLAFILNPTLSSQELLATICDQLKIRYRKTGATLKTLTDKISEKLLKNHENGNNTLLIIDEAQHLEAQVLEQLRLLTNLETDTKKLLQVILIGQPELQQLLKRRDLRQLAQRITARYHLLPLNKTELRSYVRHRLSVAGCHRVLFDPSALAAIHKLSQGIPRLINLLCHSALMEAYNSNNAVVNKKIVLKAASHALGDDFAQVMWWQQKNSQIALAGAALASVLLLGFWFGKSEQPEPLLVTNNESAQIQQEPLPEISNESAQTQQEQLPVSNDELVQTPQERQEQAEQLSAANNALVEKIVKEQLEKIALAQSKQTPQLVISGEKNASVSNNNEPQQQATPPVAENTVTQSPPVNQYQVEAVDGVSDDLLARFQAAIDDTQHNSPNESQPESNQNDDVKSLSQMPPWLQDAIPSLRFEQHIYASDGEGWVNVNGRDRYEGDSIANGVVLEKILPQQVVLTYRGEKFTLPALTSW